MMDLTIIIVSYNVRELLRKCLESVSGAGQGIDFEIYVVDNDSDDNSSSMVAGEFPHIKLISNKTNIGFSAASNQAIRMARGRYILLLNPDTLIGKDALTRCIEFMDSHDDAGALGVKMVNGEGKFLPESKRALPSSLSAFSKSFGLSYLFPKSKVLNRYYMTQIGTDETSKSEILSGAFMFIRKETLDKTGFLDEDYFMYGEDIDLSYRILEAGYNNYYFPEVKITHFKGCSTPKHKYDDIFYFYKAMRIYIRKRSAGGKFRFSSLFLIPGVYFREAIAILNRFVKILFRI